MKKEIPLFAFLIAAIQGLLYAQPPGRPDQPANTIPKNEIARPQNPKLTPLTFEQILDDAGWKGVRTWHTAAGITVDSITTLSFFLLNKQVTWTKQGWEFVTPTAGNYSLSKYKIIMRFSYPPYTHYMEGMYDPATKKITGTFKEERAISPNAPPAYKAGIITGDFLLVQK